MKNSSALPLAVICLSAIILIGMFLYSPGASPSLPKEVGIPGSLVVAASVPTTIATYVAPTIKPDTTVCSVCGGDGVIGDGGNSKPCWKCKTATSSQNPRGYAVIVTADACPPCKLFIDTLRTTLETATLHWVFCDVTKGAEQCACHVRICNIDSSQTNREYASSLNVSVYPTSIFYRDGKEITRISGVMTPQTFSNLIPK